MAFVDFDSIKQEKLQSREGKDYTAWVARGTKKGYQDAPDSPWKRIVFETTPVTVIEHGIQRPNQSLLQFLVKGCDKGDRLVIKSVRNKRGWDIATIENRSKSKAVLDWTPLSVDEADHIRNTQAAIEMQEDPTRPAAPNTPFTRPINYTMPGTEEV